MVYWITGRRDSGKTILAKKIQKELSTPTIILDGDELREVYVTGFSDKDRREHILRTAKLANIFIFQGFNIIIALMSSKREWRMEARELLNTNDFKLIYLEGGWLWPKTTYEEPDEEELNYGS